MSFNFSYKNLQGRSFKNQTLVGADFSYSDIRGTDFTNAVLTGANFSHSRAGLQLHQAVYKLCLSFLLTALLGFVSGLGGLFVADLLTPKSVRQYIVPSLTIPIALGLLFIFIIRKSYAVATEVSRLSGHQEPRDAAVVVPLSLVFAGLGTVALAVAIVLALTGYFAVAIALIVGGVVVLILALLLALAMAGVVIVTGPIAVAVALAGTVAVAGAIARVLVVSKVLDVAEAISLVIIGAVIVALLGLYIGFRALAGDYQFAWIRMIAVNFAAVGGTSFRRADLTNANFTQAILKSTDFREANLTHTRWFQARQLDRARVDKTILAQSSVRELVVTGFGRNKSYIGVNLKKANLIGADLSYADFREADISEATLQGACLEGAKLTRTQAIGTDFTGAVLTGACLEAWNIDSTTKLEQVDCKFVYLLQDPKPGSEDRERRPSSGEFATGEFEKLFKKALNTVDLIFRNGINKVAFISAFKKLQVENEETELSIQSIEDKGEGVVIVRVSGPPTINKAKIYSELTQTYKDFSKTIYNSNLSASGILLPNSDLESYIDSKLLAGFESVSKVYQEALDKGDYAKAAEAADAAYRMCQSIAEAAESLDEEQQKDIYLRIVALSSYWKLNKDLYNSRSNF